MMMMVMVMMMMMMMIARAGFWPIGQNPRRHHSSPRTYIRIEFDEKNK